MFASYEKFWWDYLADPDYCAELVEDLKWKKNTKFGYSREFIKEYHMNEKPGSAQEWR